MNTLTFLSVEEKEDCVVRYKKGESIKKLAEEYDVTERSIRRWCSKYDGTTESLKNGSHVPLTPHPKKCPNGKKDFS